MSALATAAARVGRPPRRQAANISFHETAGAPAVVRHPVLQRSVANPNKMLVVRSKGNLRRVVPEAEDDSDSPNIDPGATRTGVSRKFAQHHMLDESDEHRTGGDSNLESSPYRPPEQSDIDSEEEGDDGDSDASLSEDVFGQGGGKSRGKRQVKSRNSKQPSKRARQVREDERIAFQARSTSLPAMTVGPSKTLARRLFGAPPTAGAVAPPAPSGRVASAVATRTPAAPSVQMASATATVALQPTSSLSALDIEAEGERGDSAEDDYAGPASRAAWTFDKRGRLHTRPASVGVEFSHINAARLFILNHIASVNPWPDVSEETKLISHAWIETFDTERDGTVACPSLDERLFYVLKERISIWRGQLFSAIKGSIADWYDLGPLPSRYEKARDLLGNMSWVFSYINDRGKRVGAFGHRAILRAVERTFFNHGPISYGFKFEALAEEVPPPTIALVCTALYAALKSCDGVSGTVRFERKAFADIYEQVLSYYRRKLQAEKLPFRSEYPARLRAQAAAVAQNSSNSLTLVATSEDDSGEEEEDLDSFNPW